MSSARVEPVAAPPQEQPADLGRLLEAHWPSVYRLLLSLSGCTHEAEDLAQETFLRALQKAAALPPDSNVRAWMLRVAANAFFDERRKRKRRRTTPLAGELPAPGPPPGYALETAERGSRVRAVLGGLSELTRLVFHLRAQEDLPFRDIAELAGTTEQAARWHMRQARVRLLEQLGEDF